MRPCTAMGSPPRSTSGPPVTSPSRMPPSTRRSTGWSAVGSSMPSGVRRRPTAGPATTRSRPPAGRSSAMTRRRGGATHGQSTRCWQIADVMADRPDRPFSYLRRRPDEVRADVDEELDGHLARRVDELRARGLDETAARREALRLFGDIDRTRAYGVEQQRQKEVRMQRTLRFEDLRQDVRISMRSLLRAPALTATIVLTVGLGIGATTAMFAAIDAVLLRPLPYAAPERLVRVYTDSPPYWWRLSV